MADIFQSCSKLRGTGEDTEERMGEDEVWKE
jgi:hypothetical protein